MFTQDCNRKSQLIQGFLEGVAQHLSSTSGFVKRRSKMTGVLFTQTLILTWLHNPKASLIGLCQWAAHLGVEISPQGLAQRFNASAVNLMSTLFRVAMEQFRHDQTLPLELFKAFNAIYILDSSQIALPENLKDLFKGSGGAASKAAVKIQLSFEYLSGSLDGLEVVAGSEPDSHCRLHLDRAQAGSLHLFDLGYFKLSLFQHLSEAKAFFISRFRPHTLLFKTKDDTQALDLETFCQQLPTDSYETWLFMGAKARLPTRVLFQKLPPSVAQERRRKAQEKARRKKRTCSQKHLAMQDWSIYITNVPAETLTFEQVMLIYRLRWQIELLFKLCKSQLQLDEIGNSGLHRILCQLYARLIIFVLFLGLVAPWRVSQYGELSLPKAFDLLTFYASHLLNCITHQWQGIRQVLQNMTADFLRLAQKTKRQKSPSTLSRLIAAGGLA